MKKAKALIECFSFNQKERRENMKVVCSYNRKRLIDDNNIILALMSGG